MGRLRLLHRHRLCTPERLRATDIPRRQCNSSKSNSEVTSWMRRKRLDERAFLTQYVHVRQALGIL